MKKAFPNWYQVRIFTRPDPKDQTFNWSLGIYGDIIKRFTAEFPNVRFWFTKYYCALATDAEYSEGLPPDYLDEKFNVRSVRFRVRLLNKKQLSFLSLLLKQYEGTYWNGGIKKYDHYSDLCGERFCEWSPFKARKVSERKRRGDIVQKALEYNCRLILDCLVQLKFESAETGWFIEKNTNPNNTAFGNISRSMTHLYVNPWADSKGGHLPIYGIDWSAIYYI